MGQGDLLAALRSSDTGAAHPLLMRQALTSAADGVVSRQKSRIKTACRLRDAIIGDACIVCKASLIERRRNRGNRQFAGNFSGSMAAHPIRQDGQQPHILGCIWWRGVETQIVFILLADAPWVRGSSHQHSGGRECLGIHLECDPCLWLVALHRHSRLLGESPTPKHTALSSPGGWLPK
jgi:hypothetical protein